MSNWGAMPATDYRYITNRPCKILGEPGYETLTAAVASAGSDKITLIVPPGTWTAPASIPPNINIQIESGGMIDFKSVPHGAIIGIAAYGTTGVNVNVTGHGVVAGNYVLLSGIRQSNWSGLQYAQRVTSVPDPDHFILTTGDASGWSAYTDANGTFTRLIPISHVTAPKVKVFDCVAPCIHFGSFSPGDPPANYYVQQREIFSEWWGAVPDYYADGSGIHGTDSFAAINYAIKAATLRYWTSPHPLTVRFAGSYLVSDTITISNCSYGSPSLLSDGMTGATIYSSSAGYPSIEVGDSLKLRIDLNVTGVDAGSGYPSCGLFLGRPSAANSCSVGRFRMTFGGRFRVASVFNNTGEVNRFENFRSEASPVIISTTLNATANQNDTIISLTTNANTHNQDIISIVLDTNAKFASRITNVNGDGHHVTLADVMPSAAASGKAVTTTSWAGAFSVAKCGNQTGSIVPTLTAKNFTPAESSALQTFFDFFDVGCSPSDGCAIFFADDTPHSVEIDRGYIAYNASGHTNSNIFRFYRGGSIKARNILLEGWAVGQVVKCYSNESGKTFSMGFDGVGGSPQTPVYLYGDDGSIINGNVGAYGTVDIYQSTGITLYKGGSGDLSVRGSLAGSIIDISSDTQKVSIPTAYASAFDNRIRDRRYGATPIGQIDRYQGNFHVGYERYQSSSYGDYGTLLLGSILNRMEYGTDVPQVSGSYHKGNIRWNRNYSGSNAKGWICKSEGNYSSSNIGTGSSNGTSTVTMVTGINGMKEGKLIALAGVTGQYTVMRIIYSGDGQSGSLIMDSTVPSSAGTVNVNNSGIAPTWDAL